MKKTKNKQVKQGFNSNYSITTKETVIRFKNPQPPRKAKQNATNLAAVCCPSFSLV